MLKKWIALAMAAVFVLSISGAAMAAGKLVKVPTAWMDEHETFLIWYAKEKGWDKEAGLDVEIKYFNSGADILNALPSGEWVFAGMGARACHAGQPALRHHIIGNGNDESMTNGVWSQGQPHRQGQWAGTKIYPERAGQSRNREGQDLPGHHRELRPLRPFLLAERAGPQGQRRGHQEHGPGPGRGRV